MRKFPSLKSSPASEIGASTAEYAVILAAIILLIVAILSILANPQGDGLTQQSFSAVGNKAGQFGKIE